MEVLEERTPTHADVNTDGKVTAADALYVVNRLPASEYSQFTDVNRDLKNTALDALIVINYIDGFDPQHTVTVWLDPNATTHDRTFRELDWAVREAIWQFERINRNVDFVLVENRRDGEIRIATKSLPINGGPYHAKGWYEGRGRVFLHDGNVYAQHSPTGQYIRWVPFARAGEDFRRVSQHEMWHHFFGPAHSSDYSCVSHIDARPNWCAAEIDAIMREWQ